MIAVTAVDWADLSRIPLRTLRALREYSGFLLRGVWSVAGAECLDRGTTKKGSRNDRGDRGEECVSLYPKSLCVL